MFLFQNRIYVNIKRANGKRKKFILFFKNISQKKIEKKHFNKYFHKNTLILQSLTIYTKKHFLDNYFNLSEHIKNHMRFNTKKQNWSHCIVHKRY